MDETQKCGVHKQLRSIRESKGLTIEQVAKQIGLEAKVLMIYEINPEETPLSIAVKILGLYEVHSLESIWFR